MAHSILPVPGYTVPLSNFPGSKHRKYFIQKALVFLICKNGKDSEIAAIANYATYHILITSVRYRGQEAAGENAPMHSHLGILGVTGFLMQTTAWAAQITPWMAMGNPYLRRPFLIHLTGLACWWIGLKKISRRPCL
jgi:hypothetical protein